ncbi:MAG TPA: methionyl-tRNA formyltransferase, partial [Acidimicrobiales bacterium]|nr:methionyl-tRNA formyltransferase [Acidimicrobiales bacterium]
SVPFMTSLNASGYEIGVVVTGEDRRRGRGEEPSPSPVKRAAIEMGLTVIHEIEEIENFEIDLAVVVAYGSFIPIDLLERVPMINVHFSLLPRWRGPAPIERAILAGDTKSGVCVMKVGEEFDVGDVFTRQEVEISPRDTTETLRDRLVEAGCELLVSTLDDGLSEPAPQVGEIVWAEKVTPQEREIDWGLEAEKIDRLVRVGGAWTTFRGERFKIWKTETTAREIQGRPGQLLGDEVASGKGSLRLIEVQSQNRARQAFDSWKLGARLEENCVFGDD